MTNRPASRALGGFYVAAAGLLLAASCGGGSSAPVVHVRGFSGGAPAGQPAGGAVHPAAQTPAAAPGGAKQPGPGEAAAPGAAAAETPASEPATIGGLLAVFRPNLGDEDFSEDPTGETVRDPFRSYLLGSSSPVVEGGPTHKTLMEKYRLEDVKLTGILRQGSVYTALFVDPTGLGWEVKRGDYIASNDAYVDLIDDEGAVLKIGGGPAVATPTAAGSSGESQPPVTTIRIPIHPEDMIPTSTSP